LVSAGGVLVLAYLALLPMAIAYLLFGYGLRGLPASTATTLALAEPVVATTLATVLLHEHLGAASWAGLVLILVGILVVAVAEQEVDR
jgi:DME family drug/metabolite transporter